MTQWEHLVEEHVVCTAQGEGDAKLRQKCVEWLNALGQQGWEMVTVAWHWSPNAYRITAVAKRPIERGPYR